MTAVWMMGSRVTGRILSKRPWVPKRKGSFHLGICGGLMPPPQLSVHPFYKMHLTACYCMGSGPARACPEGTVPGSPARALPLPTALGGCANTAQSRQQPHPGAPATQAWVLVPREGGIICVILDVIKGGRGVEVKARKVSYDWRLLSLPRNVPPSPDCLHTFCNMDLSLSHLPHLCSRDCTSVNASLFCLCVCFSLHLSLLITPESRATVN